MLTWLKTHKALAALLVIVGFFAWNIVVSSLGLGSMTSLRIPTLRENSASDYGGGGGVLNAGINAPAGMSLNQGIGVPQPVYEPASNSQNRVVIQSSDMSLVVKDVKSTGDQIIQYAKNIGGFMVDTSYSNPTESPYAQVAVRVPTDRLDESLKYFRSLAVKVSSENLTGTDVTDQYQDLDARLNTLRTTKSKFDEIMTKAVTAPEIMQVEQEIINLQQQIDSVTGEKLALSDNAKLTKITVYLSSDELALPYVPDNSFRPSVIFKEAVRSLVNSLRSLASALIWLSVFSVIWVPVLIAYLGFRRWKKHRGRSTPPAAA